MGTSQGISAMAGAAVNMSRDGAAFMMIGMGKFMRGKLKNSLEDNPEIMTLLARANTSSRHGEDAFVQLSKSGRAEGSTVLTEGLMRGAELLQKGPEQLLKLTLANQDKIAGMMSFAGYYHDRMKQKHPTETKDMSFDEFFAWANTKAGSNADKDAIAYADQQVNRSQLIASPQNQGTFMKDQPLLAKVLFPFGRFAYNRKVGMSNDYSIINSDIASEADKGRARNRLKSAAVEIAAFKLIQPIAGTFAAKAALTTLAGLVGFDDEYDKLVKNFERKIFAANTTTGEFTRKRFEVSNFERNIQKEFLTQLIDGMIPIPTPGIANEIVYAKVNQVMAMSGLAEEDFFTVYSSSLRAMFEDTDARAPQTAMGQKEMLYAIFGETGMISMTADDIYNTFAVYKALTDNVVANDFSSSAAAREYRPEVREAVKTLAKLTALELLVPSADLRRFNRQLKGVLDRKYTQTQDGSLIQDAPENTLRNFFNPKK